MDKKFLVVKKRSEVNKTVIPFFELSLQAEEIDIKNSLGRYSAEKIVANSDIPQFKKSLVDGYAVKSSDIKGASSGNPVPLKLRKVLKIGEAFKGILENGETVFVPTGGIVPDGADSLVMIEHTEKRGDEIFVFRDIHKKENLIEKGDDLKEGEIVIKKGAKLTPERIATLRAFGIKKVKVFKKIKAGIISTGDELIDSGTLEYGKIFDINGYSVYAESLSYNFFPVYYGITKDNEKLIKNTLEKALNENDIVIMSGGTSKGSFDYTVSAIEGLKNGRVLIHGLHLSPGKPTVIGVGNGKLIAGLSGNPLASFLVFRKVIVPLVFEKTGLIQETYRVYAELMENAPSRKGREEFVICKLTATNGKNLLKPLFSESAFVGVLEKGDGIIDIPLMSEGIKKGERVIFELW